MEERLSPHRWPALAGFGPGNMKPVCILQCLMSWFAGMPLSWWSRFGKTILNGIFALQKYKAGIFNLVEGGFCPLLWGWQHWVWCLYDEEPQWNVLWGQCSWEHTGIVSLHVGNMTVPYVAHLMSWVILTDTDGLSPFPSPHWGCKIPYSTVTYLKLLFVFGFFSDLCH